MRLLGETIEIELVLAPDLGPVRADPGQIEQVVVNLAINARDAMSEGGTLRLETSHCAAPVGESDHDGEWVRLAVSDTGHGMDDATLDRAFEPFFTTKEQGKGTGLGLSTVHGIVSQSGGEIAMRSDPGRGTLVEVFLPRAVPERAGESPGREVEHARVAAGSGHVILLVEDDAMVRRLASRALASAGYEVIEASDGVEAFETFEACQDRVDLVLTDVVMPRRSGADLARALRDLRPSLPVLFMSGYPNPREGGESPLPASEAFVQKPFSPSALRERVAELLGHKRDDFG
jgi:CheY-like chemotaxis protein